MLVIFAVSFYLADAPRQLQFCIRVAKLMYKKFNFHFLFSLNIKLWGYQKLLGEGKGGLRGIFAVSFYLADAPRQLQFCIRVAKLMYKKFNFHFLFSLNIKLWEYQKLLGEGKGGLRGRARAPKVRVKAQTP